MSLQRNTQKEASPHLKLMLIGLIIAVAIVAVWAMITLNQPQTTTTPASAESAPVTINMPPPTCTPNWQCDAWHACTTDNLQRRNCRDYTGCNTNSGEPATTQSCTYIPLCNPNWECAEWSACSQSGKQTRQCIDTNNCSSQTGKPAITTSCTPPKVDVTIHSVKKLQSLGEYSDASAGNVFLVIDLSIKNNMQSTYDYNPNNVQIEDEKHYTYDYSWQTHSLTNDFNMVDIPTGATKRGVLAFEVPITSTTYIMTVKSDMFGIGGDLATVNLGSIQSISEVEVETLPEESIGTSSGTITIKKVDIVLANLYPIRVEVENTGTKTLIPNFDITVKKGSKTVCEGASSWDDFSWDGIEPGKTPIGEVTMMGCMFDEDGNYELTIELLDEDYNKLDSDSEDFEVDYWSQFEL